MSEQRPSGGARSELRRTIQPWDTDIPLISADPFNLDADLIIGGEEYIRCTSRSEHWLLGCERGLHPEEGGVAARKWVGGTPVDQVPWTTTEVVTTLPTPAVADAGRQIHLTGAAGEPNRSYIGSLLENGTPFWDEVNDATYTAGTLTIAGGAITLPRIKPNIAIIYALIDTEGGAATDDLTDINTTGTVEDGTLLILRTIISSRDVAVKGSVGNIWIGNSGSETYTLNNGFITHLTLVREGGLWAEQSRTSGVPVVTIRTNSAVVGGAAAGSVTASCNAGEIVSGGGCTDTGSASSAIHPYENFPASTTTWRCSIRNLSGSNETLTAYAICLR